MDDFIAQAASKFGISADATKSLTGGLLQQVQKHSDASDFSQLTDKIPGVSGLLDSAGGGGGGLLGGMLGKVGLGGAANVMGLFKKANLDSSNIGGFIEMLSSFLKEKLGDEMVTKLLGNIPGLSKLLG